MNLGAEYFSKLSNSKDNDFIDYDFESTSINIANNIHILIKYLYSIYKFKSTNLLDIIKTNKESQLFFGNNSSNCNINNFSDNLFKTNELKHNNILDRDEYIRYKQHSDYVKMFIDIQNNWNSLKRNLTLFKKYSDKLNLKEELKKVENIVEMNFMSLNHKKIYDLYNNYNIIVVKIYKHKLNHKDRFRPNNDNK